MVAGEHQERENEVWLLLKCNEQAARHPSPQGDDMTIGFILGLFAGLATILSDLIDSLVLLPGS